MLEDKKMRRASQVSFEQLAQVMSALNGIDFTDEDIAQIGEDPNLLIALQSVIYQHRRFNNLDAQRSILLRIAQERWHRRDIVQELFDVFGPLPQCPPSDKDHLHFRNWFYHAGDPIETLYSGWLACEHIFGVNHVALGKGVIFDAEHIRLRNGAIQRSPGLHLAICEGGRTYCGIPAGDAIEAMENRGIVGLGPELPLVFALNPNLVRVMDGKKTPYLYAPDLEFSYDGALFHHTLGIRYDRQKQLLVLEPHRINISMPGFGGGWYIDVEAQNLVVIPEG